MSKELFKFTTRIFVSQNCSNCTCFMLILYFFSEFFLFFSFRNPRGSLKEVVNREDMYHQLLVMNPSLFGGNSQSENSFELSCAFLDITNYYCLPYYAWLHEVYFVIANEILMEERLKTHVPRRGEHQPSSLKRFYQTTILTTMPNF